MFYPARLLAKTHLILDFTTRQALRCRFRVVLVALALGSVLVSPPAHAVTPAPDGGYPGANTAEGDSALQSLTTGRANTAVGAGALGSNSTGDSNTAVGASALNSNKTDHNTAVGSVALFNNTTGEYNTATGWYALFSNTTGLSNTATGVAALGFNETGGGNTATGRAALAFNITGSENTASGTEALFNNRTGHNNTASGFGALERNEAGNNNTATGHRALLLNSNGNYNTAIGQGALLFNTNGSNNTADGQNALKDNTTGSGNIALGSNAGLNLTTGSNNIEIGNRGVAGDTGTIRIGNAKKQTATFIAGISGATVAGGAAVFVDADGHLGTVTSSARFKDGITPMDKASEGIYDLEPVTFHYKPELDSAGIPQFGLVAEQVEKVSPDLVARDEHGKAYTVRYEAVNAMLLNEFLKEHRKVEAQERKAQEMETRLSQEESTIAEQQKQIDVLKDGLRRVSEQSRESGPQTVGNNF